MGRVHQPPRRPTRWRRPPRRPRKQLLGDTSAIVTSARWWASSHLPVRRRQVCWAHLRRDFQAQAEGLDAEQEFGEAGRRICEQLFWAWEVFQHTSDRGDLKRAVRALQRQLKPLARRSCGKAPRYKRTRGLARNLLKVWPALVDIRRPRRRAADQQPRRTRAPRRGHLQKLTLGSQSDDGERRIARLLSAHTTCRLQRRSLHAYLIDAITAHTRGQPVPLLA